MYVRTQAFGGALYFYTLIRRVSGTNALVPHITVCSLVPLVITPERLNAVHLAVGRVQPVSRSFAVSSLALTVRRISKLPLQPTPRLIPSLPWLSYALTPAVCRVLLMMAANHHHRREQGAARAQPHRGALAHPWPRRRTGHARTENIVAGTRRPGKGA